TQNPIYIWRCYRAARKAGVPIPSRVLEYLDECADRLERAETPKGIMAALGLNAKGGPSKRRQALRHDRDEAIVEDILFFRDTSKCRSLDAIVEDPHSRALASNSARRSLLEKPWRSFPMRELGDASIPRVSQRHSCASAVKIPKPFSASSG